MDMPTLSKTWGGHQSEAQFVLCALTPEVDITKLPQCGTGACTNETAIARVIIPMHPVLQVGGNIISVLGSSTHGAGMFCFTAAHSRLVLWHDKHAVYVVLVKYHSCKKKSCRNMNMVGRNCLSHVVAYENTILLSQFRFKSTFFQHN